MEATQDLSHRLWNQLPLELKREILILLAETSSSEARQLRLVSSDVNILVLPVLFRDVVMTIPDHVARFTSTLLPKRKNYIPALKSKLHIMPRMLSTYKVDTWVFVVNDRRPSIETALANVGPVFTSVSKLAITSQNLATNAFWLRKHPIRPKTMMIVHYGSPHLVNFYDPIFQSVTHLYTCITHGHRYSTVADLPSLTDLAVSTRAELPETTARNLVASLKEILKKSKSLQSLVFVVNADFLSEDWIAWKKWLEPCSKDGRFTFLTLSQPPRREWYCITHGLPTIWDRAKKGRAEGLEPSKLLVFQKWMDKEREVNDLMDSYQEREWEIDLVQRDDYHHPQADDPDLRLPTGFISAFG
ncbi:hypothetical protein NLJ89_g6497 [Agrocybe chaxingu]|uniref:Uncharacterized protein n=1 Tax=Agrocybe chaxingu TaxID=84603 RepID=A0A9W8JZ26_9AGAR|nr:hypothetical protein NLJ89_g6497 [Agrocybe chaxingu]